MQRQGLLNNGCRTTAQIRRNRSRSTRRLCSFASVCGHTCICQGSSSVPQVLDSSTVKCFRSMKVLTVEDKGHARLSSSTPGTTSSLALPCGISSLSRVFDTFASCSISSSFSWFVRRSRAAAKYYAERCQASDHRRTHTHSLSGVLIVIA